MGAEFERKKKQSQVDAENLRFLSATMKKFVDVVALSSKTKQINGGSDDSGDSDLRYVKRLNIGPPSSGARGRGRGILT